MGCLVTRTSRTASWFAKLLMTVIHVHRQILADKEAAATSHEDHEELEWWFDVEEGFQERCLSEKAWNAVAAQVCKVAKAVPAFASSA